MTSYVPNHSASDLPSVVIDNLVEFGIGLIPFGALIALVIIYVVARNMLR